MGKGDKSRFEPCLYHNKPCIFYLLLKKFLFKPVMDIMEKREQMIADGIRATRMRSRTKRML